MTVYKPMTPQLRRKIDEAYDEKMKELNECKDTPYVQMLRELYSVQRTFLKQFPDGYLLPFEEGKK